MAHKTLELKGVVTRVLFSGRGKRVCLARWERATGELLGPEGEKT